jgi:hypothetical protein
MAPLPPENTNRYFLDYEGPMGKRTMQFRSPGILTTNEMVSGITSFINVIKPMVYSAVTFTGLRFAATGSNISNPVAWTPITGTAAGTQNASDYPKFVSFIGRSLGGRRVRIYVYGVNVQVSDDYRLVGTENATVNAGKDFLNGPSGIFSAIDGQKPVWKAYGNTGYNAYHQRKRRTAV